MTLCDSVAGWSVTSWETVSLDVWWFVVVSGVWLGRVSSVLLGVCGEVESGVDTFFEETAVWAVEVRCCGVLVVIFSGVETILGFSVTVKVVNAAVVVKLTVLGAGVEELVGSANRKQVI